MTTTRSFAGRSIDSLFEELDSRGIDRSVYTESLLDHPEWTGRRCLVEVLIADSKGNAPKVTTSHTNCNHEATPAARAQCRKATLKATISSVI